MCGQAIDRRGTIPSSGTYRIDRALQHLLGERYVGEILSVEVQMLQRGFASFGGELDWRHDAEFSRGDQALPELANPREEQASHRVEEEFINAIRGREQISASRAGTDL